MSVELDHILWAASRSRCRLRALAKLTGVTRPIGGSHPGFGTRNSLLSLGATYLEIISPDPAQSLEGNRGGLIASLAAPGLMTFAVRTTYLAAYAASAKQSRDPHQGPVKWAGRDPTACASTGHASMSKTHVFGETIPFAIDWKASPHPSVRRRRAAGSSTARTCIPRPTLAAVYREMGIDGAGRAVPHGIPRRPRHAPRRGRAQSILTAAR